MTINRSEFLNNYAICADHIDSIIEQKFHQIESCSEEDLENEIGDAKYLLLCLQKAILLRCTDCKLSRTRTNMVFGEGNPDARVIFIGEGPGQNEDETGRPFVGRAGELLEKIIVSMDLKREDVYIANIVKCRPPENRNPENDEVLNCRKYLDKQIEVIAPDIIIALGSSATKTLLSTDQGIMSLRGNFQKYKGRAVMPTFHPGYLLRNPDAKKDVWDDIKKVMTFLADLNVQN